MLQISLNYLQGSILSSLGLFSHKYSVTNRER